MNMCLTNNIFLLQAMILGRESRLTELLIETYVQNDDR